MHANSVQPLSSRHVRRMITMIKVAEYDAQLVSDFRAAHGPPTMAIDDLVDFIYLPKADLCQPASQGDPVNGRRAARLVDPSP